RRFSGFAAELSKIGHTPAMQSSAPNLLALPYAKDAVAFGSIGAQKKIGIPPGHTPLPSAPC
ncbi:MAG: hypothetical protein LW833_12970, partial [Hyphomicrobiales bacterium]|nr:hypothetical protein [Hyphomicrobiales bacterium]